jgi:prevent-host-death family protein
MLTAGIKELKNNLSRYLSRVKKGEDILITERGKTIARIVKEDQRSKSARDSLLPLISKGVLVPPSRVLEREIAEPLQVPGDSVSDMVIEDRR